jgi:sugar phosphate isomerase/epimerase
MLFVSSTVFKYDIMDNYSWAHDNDDIGIELSGGKHHPHGPLFEKISNILNNNNKKILVHNYFPVPDMSFVLNLATQNNTILENCFNMLKRATSLCSRFEVPYYSFHPGYLYDGEERPDGHFAFSESSYLPYDQALSRFFENFQTLYAMARENGVLLAVENLFPDAEGRQTSLNGTPEEFEEMMDAMPRDVGVLLDLGHLNISAAHNGFDKYAYIDRLLSLYGDRLFEVHLSANNGLKDEHLPVAEGDWQLDVLRLFANCPGALGQGVNITLESRNLDHATLDATCRTIQSRINV